LVKDFPEPPMRHGHALALIAHDHQCGSAGQCTVMI
jgi:hypothetical protein